MLGLLNRQPGALPDLPSFFQCLQADPAPSWDAVLAQMKTEGSWSGAATCPAPGLHRHLELRATALKDARGRMFACLVVARDAVREQSLEKQLLQSQQMDLVDNLAAGIVHEYKNLLMIIMSYASLLKDRITDQEMQADMARIEHAAHSANELTGRLVAITRRSARLADELDLKTILADVAAMLTKSLPRNIKLTAPEPPPLPKAHTDRNLLYRIVLNLCLNAREAMPDGGKLTLEADQVRIDSRDLADWPEHTPGLYLCLSVTDTGSGMPPEIKDHIFEPFFTTRKSAAGLGLAVARHILRAAGGWITAYSEPGLGSCFRIYVPAAGTLPSPLAEAPGEGPGPSGTERILVVDDDPLALNVAQRLLQRAGYTAWTAPGGEEAIEFIRKRRDEIDLVLLDIVMPFVNGEDVYKEIQRLKPGLPVLLVTGFTAKTAEHLIQVPGARILTKPFTQRMLTQTVRDVLDRKATGASPL